MPASPLADQLISPFPQQISDAMYSYIGPYQGPTIGKAISMEFGLFTTVVVLLIGGTACLLATFTVETDRMVSVCSTQWEYRYYLANKSLFLVCLYRILSLLI